ncbi:hypothetical protein ES703_94579 [subsurface metagenome]
MAISTLRHTHALEVRYKKPDIVTPYRLAKKIVLHTGYGVEIEWQASLSFNNIEETDFLREHAWVALSAGMHESIIRRHFQRISRCFCDWQSARIIVEQEDKCRRLALRHFNNHRKIDGIIETARIINSFGFESYKEAIQRNPLQVLQSLPFVGPITRYHLAKNIGLPFAKPDRHLVRLANSVGYSDVQQFCKDISEHVDDSIPVIDIVLWRFATITTSYLGIFCDAAFKE